MLAMQTSRHKFSFSVNLNNLTVVFYSHPTQPLMEKEPAALGVQSSAAGPDQLWAPGGHRPHLRGPGRVTKQSKPVVSSLQFALQESVLVEKKKK